MYQQRKRYKTFFTSKFGDKNFLRYYWNHMLPGLLFGFFFAMGPIMVSYVIGGINRDGTVSAVVGKGLTIPPIFFFFTSSIVKAAVNIIGSRIASENRIQLHELIRFLFYSVIGIAGVLIAFLFGFQNQIAQNLLASKNSLVPNFEQYVIRFNSIAVFGILTYCLAYLYQPLFSSLRKIKEQFYAALCFFTFLVLSFSLYAYAGRNDTILTKVTVFAFFYVLAYFVQYLFYLVYTYLPKIYTFKFLPYNHYRLGFNIQSQYNTAYFENMKAIKQLCYQSRFLYIYVEKNTTNLFTYFHTGVGFRWRDVKNTFILGWAVFLDQITWGCANVIFITLSVNVRINSWSLYNFATITPGLLNTYVYSIASSFNILPVPLVAKQLGKGDFALAKTNGWRLYWWGQAIGFILFCIILVFAVFFPVLITNNNVAEATNELLNPNLSAAKKTQLQTLVNNKDYIIRMSTYMTIYFAFSVWFNSAYQITLGVLFAGGNKFVQLINSFVTVLSSFGLIFVLNQAIIHQQIWLNPSEGNFISYYVLGKIYVFFKFIFGTILLTFTNWFHTEKEIIFKKGNKRK